MIKLLAIPRKSLFKLVVNDSNPDDAVVNIAQKMVVNRSLDRHNKANRREYMRNYMRKKRLSKQD